MMPLIVASRAASMTADAPDAPDAAFAGGAGFWPETVVVVLPDPTVGVDRACAATWTLTGTATARRTAHAPSMSARRRRNALDPWRPRPILDDCRSGRWGFGSSTVGNDKRGTYAEALNRLLSRRRAESRPCHSRYGPEFFAICAAGRRCSRRPLWPGMSLGPIG